MLCEGWCGERWCETKWCAKDGSVKDGVKDVVSKMVCQSWCVRDGV